MAIEGCFIYLETVCSLRVLWYIIWELAIFMLNVPLVFRLKYFLLLI